MEKRVENWNQVHSYKLNTKFLKPIYKSIKTICKRPRDSILSPFFHSYIFAMYKNEALWI